MDKKMNRFKLKNTFSKIAASLLIAVPLAAPAMADARIEVGILTCEVQGGTGLIITSKKEMTCTFSAIDDFTETYDGTIRKFGIDIGETDYTTIKWAVFAPTTEMEAGAFEGTYVGLSAEATLGAGLGANALIGGFDQSIALQPFSGQVQEGLNIAAGVGALTLRNRN